MYLIQCIRRISFPNYILDIRCSRGSQEKMLSMQVSLKSYPSRKIRHLNYLGQVTLNILWPWTFNNHSFRERNHLFSTSKKTQCIHQFLLLPSINVSMKCKVWLNCSFLLSMGKKGRFKVMLVPSLFRLKRSSGMRTAYTTSLDEHSKSKVPWNENRRKICS